MQKENFHNQCQARIGNYIINYSKILGKGATGTVYHGHHCETNTPVAIKHIDLATINDDATKILLQNEQKALKLIEHSNILKLHQIIETTGNLYIVTQVLEGGTLKDYLLKRGHLDELQAMSLFRGILSGSNQIIRANVIHRDLKPANIMLSGTNMPKIIDFGFCEVIMGGGVVRAFNVGSPAYMAPEALMRTLYSEKSDSWSLGIILYEMLHGNTPDGGRNVKQFLQQIRNNPSLINKSIKAGLNKNVREILEKSLKYKPEERMSISGMKYLTDLYQIQHKEKSLSIPQVNSNNGLNQFGKRTQIDFVKQKMLLNNASSNITVKNVRQNQFSRVNSQCFSFQGQTPRNQPFTTHHLPQPTHFQPTTMPSSGFITYAQFTKTGPVCISSNHQSRISQASVSSGSIKASSIVKKQNENSTIFMGKNQPIDIGEWKYLSSKEIIDNRPKGSPMYRQVTVRYL